MATPDPKDTINPGKGKYDGVVPRRWTTDPLFFLAIVGLWVAMSIVGGIACQEGNPALLTSPINDQGLICGVTESVKSEPYFYSVLTNGVGICTTGCPKNNSAYTSTNPNDYYCLDYINSQFPSTSSLSTYIQDFCFSNGQFLIKSNCGCMLMLDTQSQFHRCNFVDESVSKQFATQEVKDLFIRFIGDVNTARGIVFGYGIGATVAVSFIYITLLRSQCLAKTFIWGAMLAMLVCLAVFCGLAYQTANTWEQSNPKSHSNDEIVGLRVVSAVLLALGLLWALFMLFSCSAINLAIKLMSLTAECIEEMPLILLTPIIKTAGIVAFLVPWLIYCLMIASTGSFQTKTASVPGTSGYVTYQYEVYNLSGENVGRLWFQFFCFLWTIEFIVAVGVLVISIATANWYFSKPEQRTIKGGSHDWNLGWRHTIRYHLGTAAFGSLIIAVIEFIRAIALYIEKQVKKNADNCLVKWLFCCVNCCLCCLECCLRYITAQAYIQTAIHGNSFCFAAKDAFFLVARNILRIGALESLEYLAMFVGKVLIISVVGTTTYFILQTYYEDRLTGLMGPTILTIFISWAVSSVFTSVFGAVAESLLQCYVTDEENHNGVAEYASSSLRMFVDAHTMTQEEYDVNNGVLPSARANSVVAKV